MKLKKKHYSIAKVFCFDKPLLDVNFCVKWNQKNITFLVNVTENTVNHERCVTIGLERS